MRPLASLVALVALTGCQGQPVAPAAPVDATGQPAPAASAPASPAAPVAIASMTLSGRVQALGQPLANATVQAYRPGQRTALASATSTPDGRFALTLPTAVPAGSLLTVVATQGERRVATLVEAGAGDVSADEVTSAAFLLLKLDTVAAAIEAPAAAQRRTLDAADNRASARRKLLAALTAFATVLKEVLATTSPALVTTLVLGGIGEGGAGTLDATGSQQLTAGDARLKAAFTQAARALEQALGDAIAAGAPPASLTLQLGTQRIELRTAPPPSGGGNGGGDAGGDDDPPPAHVGVSVDFSPPFPTGDVPHGGDAAAF